MGVLGPIAAPISVHTSKFNLGDWLTHHLLIVLIVLAVVLVYVGKKMGMVGVIVLAVVSLGLWVVFRLTGV
jgi:hypothetical protein